MNTFITVSNGLGYFRPTRREDNAIGAFIHALWLFQQNNQAALARKLLRRHGYDVRPSFIKLNNPNLKVLDCVIVHYYEE